MDLQLVKAYFLSFRINTAAILCCKTETYICIFFKCTCGLRDSDLCASHWRTRKLKSACICHSAIIADLPMTVHLTAGVDKTQETVDHEFPVFLSLAHSHGTINLF